MKKHTVESLMENGWIGIAKHKITGNEQRARYVLDSISWTANNRLYRLKFKIENNIAYVWIENECWIPERPNYEYMYKNLTERKENVTIKELLE